MSADTTDVALPREEHTHREWGLLIIAGILALVAALLIYGNLTMRVSGEPDLFGPQTMPWITAGLCLLAAVLLTIETFRHPVDDTGATDPMTARATVHDPFDDAFAPTVLAERHADVPADPGTNWRGLAIGVGSLLLFTAVLEPLGWLVSATVLFFLMAYALGGRQYVTMALAGLGLASLIQVVFSGLLGMTLPSGVLGA